MATWFKDILTLPVPAFRGKTKTAAGSIALNFQKTSIIEKGSIAVNGISLTCFDVSQSAFSVAIIPYTFEHTNLSEVFPGTKINLEFDLMGKYLQRKWSLEQPEKS